MTISAPSALCTESRERVLGVLVDELTAKLQAGESVDLEAYVREHPEQAESLGRLFPALHVLADLGRSANRSRVTVSPEQTLANEPLGRLGDFRLIREIGRGGMGVVYEAEQISLGRQVALKVLPFAAALDAKQLQRFKNEAQAAAHLHHTNIVPVHAVGCERGVHYYAMQYIEGYTVAALIGRLRAGGKGAPSSGEATGKESTGPSAGGSTEVLGGLTAGHSHKSPEFFHIVARLGRQVAEALEYAHSLGIVHRDIKPANLLLDVRGNVWITDFGLAQCRGQAELTLTGDRLGTARYMSPEQALGKRATVNHRTDIYSLGVTLYELLTLEPAHDGAEWQEVIKQITTQEQRPPRRWNAAIPQDLETIVLKAITKEPESRYASALEMANDLGRFLENKPISARRPTFRARAVKWARRHQTAVQVAAGFLVLGVLGLAASAVLLWRERQNAETEKQRAESNLSLALDATNRMYTQVAEKWLADQPGLTQLQREFLESAVDFYERFARENGANPSLRSKIAKAFVRVGNIRQKLAEYAAANEAYVHASSLFQKLAEDFPKTPIYREELAGVYRNRAALLNTLGRFAEAEELYYLAQAHQEELAKDFPGSAVYGGELAATLQSLGILFRGTGRLHDSEAAYRRAQILLRRLVQESPQEMKWRLQWAMVQSNLAGLLHLTGRPQCSEQAYLEAVRGFEELAADFPGVPKCRQQLAAAYINLGLLLHDAGRHRAAAENFRKAQEREQQLANDFPLVPIYRHELASSHLNLGRVQAAMGQAEGAESSLRKAQALCQKLAEDFPRSPTYRTELARCHYNLATLLRGTDRPTDAESLYRSAATLQQQLADEFPFVPAHRVELGVTWENLGGLLAEGCQRLADAESYFRQALALQEKLASEYPNLPTNRQQLASTLHNLSTLLTKTNRLQEAEKVCRHALALRQRLANECPSIPQNLQALAWTQNSLGILLDRSGKRGESEAAYRAAVALQRQLVENSPKVSAYRNELGVTLDNLAELLRTHGRATEARTLVEEAIDWQRTAVKDNLHNGIYEESLSNHYRSLADTLLCLGDLANAARVAAELPNLSPNLWEAHFRAGKILVDCVAAEHDLPFDPKERAELRGTHADQARRYFQQAGELGAASPHALNTLAWYLAALCPVDRCQDPAAALSWAERAVKLAPQEASFWSTLGLAYYRTGAYQAAVAAQKRAEELGKVSNDADCLVLAMAYWQLGEEEQAHQCYQEATQKRRAQENQPELQRLRNEAAALLGVETPDSRVKEVTAQQDR